MMPIAMTDRSRVIMTVILVAIVFLALRLPGIDLPYHQDEWKNVSAAETVEGAGTFYAHPPLFQMLFVLAYNIFGEDHFRLFTVLFSVAGAGLLYLIVKGRVDARAAIWSVILYSVCFYNIFGSIQPDVDGAILPFLFLLAVYAYDRGWRSLLVTVLLVGMLIKLNFVLVIGAIVLDYLWANRRERIVQRIGWSAGAFVGFGAVYIALLYLIQWIYPAFSISFMMSHANQFSETPGRGWMQIFVQGIKAVYYLSPLLLVPLIWVSKETIKRMRVFGLYLILGFVFYFLVFDFSQGALDKYLMFAIVPLSAICGVILARVFSEHEVKASVGRWTFVGAVIAAAIFILNFIQQIVVGLYPKTEWFANVLQGNWNILTPFTGGSGPIGFYISFLFIAVSFIVPIAAALVARFRKSLLVPAALIILIIGASYNMVFAEELLYGKINGSAQSVLEETAGFVAKNDLINEVITYNDIGNRELGKRYAGRFYAAPQFEEGHREKFANFTGYYMIVDIPHLYENGFYSQFFAQCRPVFSTTSHYIKGFVYECGSRR